MNRRHFQYSRRHAGFALVVATLVFAPSPIYGQSAREILQRVDKLMRGDSSRGRVEMQITTEHWSRALEMEIWSLGTEYSLVRVESPAREAGTATLKAGQEVWNYLPRVDRTIKVPPSLMMGSWMGSHFTNDDLGIDSIRDVFRRRRRRSDIDVAGLRVWLGPRARLPVGIHVLLSRIHTVLKPGSQESTPS